MMLFIELTAAFAAVVNDPKHDGVKARHTVIEPITVSTELAL